MVLRLTFFLWWILPLSAHSQTAGSQLPGSAVIPTLYSPGELEQIAQQHPEKLEAMNYYYTQSFILEAMKCDECLPFDPSHFNISKYEHLRLKDSRKVKTDHKYGFTLTLLSKQELEYHLPVHAPQIPAENEDE